VEQSAPFGQGVKGIDVWARCRKAPSFAGVAVDVQKIVDVLKTKANVGSDWSRCSRRNRARNWAELINRFEWATGEPGAAAIKTAIAEILVLHGESARLALMNHAM